jgi:antitoxin (DNA-binding transcriptional repressor) of toxin-antitoxin stability system
MPVLFRCSCSGVPALLFRPFFRLFLRSLAALGVYTLTGHKEACIVKASFVDLRRKSADIIRALQRKEPVTVLYRGVPAAIMQPIGKQPGESSGSVKNHAAFGMWADRDDIVDVATHVRRIRRGRYDAL